VWRWYNKLYMHRNLKNWLNIKRFPLTALSNIATIHWTARSYHSGRMITTVCISLSSDAWAYFATKSSVHKFGCLSRTRKTSSCCATTPDTNPTWRFWIPSMELGENNNSSTSKLLQIEGRSNTIAHGWATIQTSPTSKAISQNWRRLC